MLYSGVRIVQQCCSESLCNTDVDDSATVTSLPTVTSHLPAPVVLTSLNSTRV